MNSLKCKLIFAGWHSIIAMMAMAIIWYDVQFKSYDVFLIIIGVMTASCSITLALAKADTPKADLMDINEFCKEYFNDSLYPWQMSELRKMHKGVMVTPKRNQK